MEIFFGIFFENFGSFLDILEILWIFVGNFQKFSFVLFFFIGILSKCFDEFFNHEANIKCH